MPLAPRYRTLGERIHVIVFGVVVFLLALELGLRLTGFLFVSWQSYQNRRALAKKNTYRILCLGESTTAGQYPSFLERILNQHHLGETFSVIDKGMVDINSSAILSCLEENLAVYKPDMVVAMMGFNDRRIVYYDDIPEAGTLFFQHCKAYRLLRLLYSRLANKSKKALGNYRKIIVVLKKAVVLHPRDDRVYVKLGWLYGKRGRSSAAARYLKKAMQINPRNDRAYIELGRLYGKENRFAQAEELFKKAAEINPQNELACLELGGLYTKTGQPLQAERVYEKAIVLNPQDGRAHMKLGWLYGHKGAFPEAQEHFKKAIELLPQNETAYVELGLLYKKEKDFLKAEECFKRAIELKPESSRSYRALVTMYEEMGKSALAEEYAKKAGQVMMEYYAPLTIDNYRLLRAILAKRGVRLVCVQYPMRSLAPLKNLFQDNDQGIVFVDNENIFKNAVRKDGPGVYFKDMFGGDFGHCTDKGNRLLAENIANTILKEVFKK